MAKLLENTIMVSAEDLVILPELEHFNLVRTDDELQNLEDQILTEGRVRDPIVVWPRKLEGQEQLVLVDGFSRRKIVTKHQIEQPLQAYQMEFEDIEEAKYWIRINQDNRRNLTDDQQAYFIGVLYNELKGNQSALLSYLKAKGKVDLLASSSDEGDAGTSKILGQIYNINEKTIRRNSQFAVGISKIREVNADLAERILHRDLTEDGKPVKINRQLIEKFSTMKAPKKIEALEDIQQVVEQSKKSEGQDVLEGKKIADKMRAFLKIPTQVGRDEIGDLMDKYLHAHGKTVTKLVA